MFDFDKDLVIEIVVIFDEQWEELLVVKSNKNVYDKFKNKAFANEKLLYNLFLDSLTIEAHVITSQNIVNIN